MSRPERPTKKHGKFNNPLSSWLAERKDRRKNFEEQAARMITNKIEDNAASLIDLLYSIDFINSRLPKEILEDRSDPELPCCKLEYATMGLIQMIQNDRQSINVDIRPIDEKLMELTLMFKQSVEHGDATAAVMAKTALHRGIKEIRCKLPQHQPAFADAFVRANAEYLDQCISLVEWAQIYDHQARNLSDKRISLQNDEAILEERRNKTRERLRSDPEYLAAFNHILNHNTPSEQAQWTKLQWELLCSMFDDMIEQDTLQLSNSRLYELESKQRDTLDKLYTLWKQLEPIPIVYDPDLLNKRRESMHELVEQIDEGADVVHIRKLSSEAVEFVLRGHKGPQELYRDLLKELSSQSEEEEVTADHKQDQPFANRNSRKKMPVSKLAAELFGEDFLRELNNCK